MKKSKIIYFILFSFIFLYISCGSPSKPSDVSKEFMKKIENNDKSAKDLLSKQLVAMLGEEKLNKAIEEQSVKIKDKGGIKSMEVLKEEATDSTATVEMKITYGNGKTDTDKSNLVKEDGKWKLSPSK